MWRIHRRLDDALPHGAVCPSVNNVFVLDLSFGPFEGYCYLHVCLFLYSCGRWSVKIIRSVIALVLGHFNYKVFLFFFSFHDHHILYCWWISFLTTEITNLYIFFRESQVPYWQSRELSLHVHHKKNQNQCWQEENKKPLEERGGSIRETTGNYAPYKSLPIFKFIDSTSGFPDFTF